MRRGGTKPPAWRRDERFDGSVAPRRRGGRAGCRVGDWSGLGVAQEKLRVAKASVAAFPFTALDVGAAEGIFTYHQLDIESVALGGDAKVQQAMASDAVDIGLGSGPSLAFIVKGAPVVGVAALSNAPSMLALVVLDKGPVKSLGDLKGRTIAVTSAGSLTEWFVSEISRRQG